MRGLFSAAVLANAALIFWVELLFGRKLLPSLGGSPAVWNTCLMFYQLVLLGGYAYVLFLDRLDPRRQFVVHAAVLVLAMAGVPWSLFLWADPGASSPVLWLLGLLTLSVGPPFFVLAAGAPLLQRWFSLSRQARSHDPYFLYAASNLGSFLALAGYPLVAEPLLTLDQQAVLWKASFGVAGLLVLGSGVAMLAQGDPRPSSPVRAESISNARRARWISLAFIPSSLLLGVTTHITSEIAPVPLLWVVPLGLYLITFVIAFGPGRRLRESPGASAPGVARGASDGRPRRSRLLAGGAGVALVLLASSLWWGLIDPGWLLIGGDLVLLFVAGVVCHVRLARDRPAPVRLAEFYLWLAVGGALGGIFNTLVAPLLFSDPLEYPLVLALFAFVVGSGVRGGNERVRASDLVLGALPGALALGLAAGAVRVGIDAGLTLPLAGAACLAITGRPVRFGLGIAGLVLVGFMLPARSGEVVFKERTFFGIHRVYWDREHLWLAHGTTVHGGQNVLEPGVPLTYYHPDGPSGSLVRAFHDLRQDPGDASVAVIGLGTGSMIAYARPGQRWTFYELDPTVARIAEDPLFFTYLRDALAPYRTVLGDARLSLADERERFDLIVVDAFTSDAVPVHLLTREAIELYRGRLSPDGWIAFHTSNRYADFSPVLAQLAREIDWFAYEGRDEIGSAPAGRYPSHWILLAPSPVAFEDARWRALEATGSRGWTDAHSSLFEVLRR